MAAPVFSPVAPAAAAPTAPGPSGGPGVPGMAPPVPGYPGIPGSGPAPGQRSVPGEPGFVGPTQPIGPDGAVPQDLQKKDLLDKLQPPPSGSGPLDRAPDFGPTGPRSILPPWLAVPTPTIGAPKNPNNLTPPQPSGKDKNGNPLPAPKNAPGQGIPPELTVPSIGNGFTNYRVVYSYTVPGTPFRGGGDPVRLGPISGGVVAGKDSLGRDAWGFYHGTGFELIVLKGQTDPEPVFTLSVQPEYGGAPVPAPSPPVLPGFEPLAFVPPSTPPSPPPPIPFNDPKPFTRPAPSPAPATPPPAPAPTSPPSPAPDEPPEPERKVPGPLPGPAPGPSRPSPGPSPGPSPAPSVPPNPKPTTFPPSVPADPGTPSVVPPIGPPAPTVPVPAPGVPSKPEPITPVPGRLPDISPGSFPGQSPARDPGPAPLAPPGPSVSPGGTPPYTPDGKTKPFPLPFPVDNTPSPLPPPPDCCAITAIDTATERIIKRIDDAQDSIEECACPVDSKIIDLAPITNLSSGTLQLPTGCISVRMKLVSEDLNIRSEYGGGAAPDVKYVGWYSLSKTDGAGGDRKPISYGDQEVDVSPLHRYLTFTCKQSNRVDVYFRKRVPLDHVGDLAPLSAVPPGELLFKKSHD